MPGNLADILSRLSVLEVKVNILLAGVGIVASYVLRDFVSRLLKIERRKS